jgi:prepilin-type N-terminal cleavage/methylation domain-containing protein
MRNAGRTNFAHRGFTLIEALIATVVLCIATVGIAQLLGISAQQSVAMRHQSISLELAKQLMEEIASKPVADSTGNISLGHETGENSRSQYDTIDDYNGYTDTTDSITMLDGTTVDLGDGLTYRRSVAVQYRMTPSGASTASASAPFCVVTITVGPDNSETTQLTRLFARTSGGY